MSTEPSFQELKAMMQEPNADAEYQRARRYMMQCANLLVLCINATNTVVAAETPEIAQTGDFFATCVKALFAEGARAGLVERMPAKKIKI